MVAGERLEEATEGRQRASPFASAHARRQRKGRAKGARVMNLAIIPLAITMNAGPQIMSAIIFITAPKPLKLSAAFLAGVVIAVTVGLTITYTFATALGNSISLGDPSDKGSIGNIIQYLLVALLVYLAIKNYVRRESIEPPRWLGALQNAKPRTAFTTGLLLLSVFPSDFVILVTVGMNLAQNNAPLVAGLPFIAATILIAAIPVLAFLLFHRRAQRVMPKVRDWMNTNSWLVNIIVYVIFILLILA
jgi:threonine/homoserine/homoserine lactone efflux protein